MKTSILLITLSGEDRPGIVSETAAKVHAHQGNWERSRLIHLSGRFVGLLQVSVPEDQRESLRADLLSIEGLELTIADGTGSRSTNATSFQVKLVGADHPGIVNEVFGALSSLGLNVESMSTRTEAAADSGTLLFRAEARLSSREPMQEATVQDHLEELGQDLLVEVSANEAG
ncbi:ACT domain-containing protein [Puniceicoccus vermicola]|uniref:Amino acid-binding protein n=1 Tax=Puniceicoccus vermicola TaxID=388746 RepID=A0A7X1AVB7_9BACT|nr:amino acid-binding protein [Puniceicoccus vermicola]